MLNNKTLKTDGQLLGEMCISRFNNFPHIYVTEGDETYIFDMKAVRNHHDTELHGVFTLLAASLRGATEMRLRDTDLMSANLRRISSFLVNPGEEKAFQPKIHITVKPYHPETVFADDFTGQSFRNIVLSKDTEDAGKRLLVAITDVRQGSVKYELSDDKATAKFSKFDSAVDCWNDNL